MEYITIAVVIAFLLDLILGDPSWLPHPVVYIGKLITFFEKYYRKLFSRSGKNERNGKNEEEISERNAGIAMTITVIFISVSLTIGVLALFYSLNYVLGFILETILCYQCFAARSLEKESMKVYKALKEEGIEEGRKQVSYIVGRDTSELDEKGVIKATVETIAENTSDGEIAPMFYMCIGGASTAIMYKAINTMDSMVGYKNAKYKNFGTCAAKLDDIVNYLPARISAVIMIFACRFNKEFNYENAKKIHKRDKKKHASPNSAQTESVCAGALGIELAGPAKYFGKKYDKERIGDSIRDIELEDIVRANKLMYDTSIYSIIIMLIIRNAIIYLLAI